MTASGKEIKDEDLPGVSVVIPAYNYARFLPFAVESARSQDYPKFEVIVIDDGSKDDTAEVMKQFGSPVRYVFQENAGLSAARNSGIREARYDFVCFLDADDELMPGMLRASMGRMAALERDFGMVGCDCVNIDIDGKPLPVTKHAPEKEGEVTVRDILIRTRFSPTGAVCRKEVFETCGGFDTSLKSTEDRDMWIRIATRYRVWHAGRELVHIRKHGENMSNNAARQSANMLVVLNKAYRSGAVPRSDFWFWRRVFAYQRFQSALIYNGIAKPLPAFWQLFRSIVSCPWFGDARYFGYPFLFRLRHFVRFALNAITGKVKR
ncbi:MAG: glycosyltransferase [Verrucomicrobiae bacterium]|jgi:glycosyltransferase involved in cell wall biosynthesis|nr:glycosyltransferase [Verrucomicrobiae bacterium]